MVRFRLFKVRMSKMFLCSQLNFKLIVNLLIYLFSTFGLCKICR